jgi:CRISPR system Cascade subunit CasB
MSEGTTEKTGAFRPAPKPLPSVADALQRALGGMSSGDRASLRKMRPDDLHQPAFWKLSTGLLQAVLPNDAAPWRDEQERRWAVVLAVAAGASHAPGMRLGAALARAHVAEVRLTRLLRARGEQLPDAVRTLAHQLVSAAVPFDFADLAWLVLSEGRDDEERARQQIARDYYRSVGAEP